MDEKRRTLVGVGCVLALMVFNILINELLQYQEQTLSFNKPVLIIWFNHTWLLFNWPIAWCLCWQRVRAKVRSENSATGGAALPTPWAPLAQFIQRNGWSYGRTAYIASVLALLYLVPNIAWAACVNRVSVTLTNAVQQSSCMFVFALSVVFLKSKARLAPLVAVCVCFGGVIVLAFGQPTGKSASSSVVDYLLLAVFPIVISAFDILFKRWSSGCHSLEDVCIYMTLIGLANMVMLCPVIPIADLAGWEEFKFPAGTQTALFVGIGAVAWAFNLAFMAGIAVTNPVFMAVGSALQLPSVYACDILLHSSTTPFNALSVCGATLIIAGFLALTFAEGDNDEDPPDPQAQAEQNTLLESGRSRVTTHSDYPLPQGLKNVI